MAGTIFPDGADAASYRGLPSLYQFVNADGSLTRFNCGQAAACTLLSHFGAIGGDACALMAAVEKANPPDNLLGYFGTSRRRVERICREHGIELDELTGEDELRAALAGNRPVAVIVELPGPVVWRWRAPAGHWMVAYGFDEEHIYLTNWGRMTWAEFRDGWRALVPRLIHMRRKALVCVPLAA